MADAAAARVQDPVGHDWGMMGMIGGAVLGAAVAGALIAATVVTGGAAAVAVAGLVAGGALAGGQLAHGLQTVMGRQNPTTGLLVHGSPDVFINDRPAVRAGPDFVDACSGLFMTHHLRKPGARVAEGSDYVFINGHPAARVGDRLECAATISTGSPNVRIGGNTTAVLEIRDNQATWTQVATVVGLVALGGGAVVAALAGTAALAGFVAVGAGFTALNAGLGWVGDRLGPGWRDTLQGGAGVVGIVAGARPAARALRGQQTAQRVRANVEASRAAREASGFGGRAPAPGSRAGLTPAQQARAQRKLAASRERAARVAAGEARRPREVVAFFDRNAVDTYYLKDRVSIGAPGRPFFVMPAEDAAAIRTTADAARLTGMAPAAQQAYVGGGDIYGLQFRVPPSSLRVPTPADARGWPHYLEGGHTAVRLPDPNGGFLINPTREFVIPGGGAPRSGDVLFRLGPNGERIPVRRF